MESLWRVRLVGQDTALSRPVHGFESRTRCFISLRCGTSYEDPENGINVILTGSLRLRREVILVFIVPGWRLNLPGGELPIKLFSLACLRKTEFLQKRCLPAG